MHIYTGALTPTDSEGGSLPLAKTSCRACMHGAPAPAVRASPERVCSDVLSSPVSCVSDKINMVR